VEVFLFFEIVFSQQHRSLFLSALPFLFSFCPKQQHNEMQNKTIENQNEKQIKTFKSVLARARERAKTEERDSCFLF